MAVEYVCKNGCKYVDVCVILATTMENNLHAIYEKHLMSMRFHRDYLSENLPTLQQKKYYGNSKLLTSRLKQWRGYFVT